MKAILEVDSILLSFGKRIILNDVYLKLEIGSVVGLIGRNGSGKTCLLRIIAGELRADNQSVRIDGESYPRKYCSSCEVKYLPQEDSIPNFLTVDKVLYDFEVSFLDLVDHFPEFDAHRNTKIDRLSGGLNRLLGIFIMLKSDTKFCLLDEPFSHVMPIHVDEISRMILEEKTRKGIIITDHLYGHVLDLSDTLYFIKDGRMKELEGEEELFNLGYLRR